ncbi:MAG: hypothetical protein HYZ26_02490 [Chloroflexi bacterium]|nr:hypothetical protein [Chloroflexota bacterium]
MSHLEDLLYEYLDWQGYLVKRNIKVGRRAKGGWEMELDLVGHHPITGDLLHLEPSLDADSWPKRESRYRKKFDAGRKYIFTAIFAWLPPATPIRQFAIFPDHPKGRSTLAGGMLVSADEIMFEIRKKVMQEGKMINKAIPEQFLLLRTIQLSHNGYNRAIFEQPSFGGVLLTNEHP